MSRRAPGVLQLRPRPTPGSGGQVPRPLDVSRPFSGMERLEKRRSAPKTQGGSVACAPTTLRPAPWLSPRERLGARERRSSAHATRCRPLGSRSVRQGRGAGIPCNLSTVIGEDRRRGGWIGGSGAELPVGAWSPRGATEAEVGSEVAMGPGGRRLGLSLHAPPRPTPPPPPRRRLPSLPVLGRACGACAESPSRADRRSLSSPGDEADGRPPRLGPGKPREPLSPGRRRGAAPPFPLHCAPKVPRGASGESWGSRAVPTRPPGSERPGIGGQSGRAGVLEEAASGGVCAAFRGGARWGNKVLPVP
ncbi:PREDICTED: translation initiation factor IF-2-like [Rhinopithecus bieti]|uniref:translation initiation factor IF-2-like n=1 Tax=Rhinopithecus bieti TaxID=61621 RepID=UPI00083C1CA3|nr:PREDICTED: translation initiation factor IF-2-like [Rhinopithecus bieti]